jgi:hypothetical protein
MSKSLFYRLAHILHMLFRQYYISSVKCALFITAIVKIACAMAGAKTLYAPSPMFAFLSTRQLLLAAAFVELIVVFILDKSQNHARSMAFILWLGSVFSCYRLCFIVLDLKGNCNCLGNAYYWLGLPEKTVDLFMLCILVYMMFFSSAFFIVNYIHNLKTPCLAKAS